MLGLLRGFELVLKKYELKHGTCCWRHILQVNRVMDSLVEDAKSVSCACEYITYLKYPLCSKELSLVITSLTS
jgi:hypothetical protein